MREHYITSTAQADMHGLAHQGISAPDQFNQLQGIVRRGLGEDHARLFANPVPNPDRREIDWYTPLQGEARRLLDLPAEEQTALRLKIRTTAQEIYNCAEAQNTSRSGQMGRHILQLALCCPGEDALWVKGDTPLCVNWGYGPGVPGQEPLKLWELPDHPPEPEAVPAAGSAAGPAAGVAATSADPPEPPPDTPAEPLDTSTESGAPLSGPGPGQPSGEGPGKKKRRFQPNWWWLLPAGLAGVALFLLMLRMGYPSLESLIHFRPTPEEQAGRARLAKLEQSLDGLWQDVKRRAGLCKIADDPPKPQDPLLPVPPPALSCANSQGIEFVLIQPGKFMMGSPAGQGSGNDQPQHEVTITRPFCLGKYELTQAQWEKVMGNNPSANKGKNHPVDNVSWNDVQTFIKKLNAAEGKPRFRLPTEAEWEYAARAGTTTTYFFGEDKKQMDRYGWCGGNTRPVGGKASNPWGLHDIYCNVEEFVADTFGPYGKGPETDPSGPAVGGSTALRGGSVKTTPGSAIRCTHDKNDRDLHLGFRLLLIPAE